MPGHERRTTLTGGAQDALHAEVSALLMGFFNDPRSQLSGLDRWTERRIRDENLAKAELVTEADDAVEHCYQNLIREIDTEARNGVFLAGTDAGTFELRKIVDETGVSGLLHSHIRALAPRFFADEAAHSNEALDLVWAGLRARYGRAHAESLVSERIMAQLLDDADAAADMTEALRALFYSWHEDEVRRTAGLETLLSEHEAADLRTMVAELAGRSGSYDERVRLITTRSGTA